MTKDKKFYHKLFQIMIPIALQSFMLSAVAAGDAVMLGRVEQDSMAAVSLATQVQFVQNMILGAIVSAATILGAQYWGKGDKKTINGIFAAGGDTLFDVYSLAVCMWGIAIPLALLGAFVFHWPVLAVYACTCLDEVGKIPWVMMHYRRYKWVKDLTRDKIQI